MGGLEPAGRAQCHLAPAEWDSWEPPPRPRINRASLAERWGHMAALPGELLTAGDTGDEGTMTLGGEGGGWGGVSHRDTGDSHGAPARP